MRNKLRASLKLFFIIAWILVIYVGLWAAKVLRKATWRDRLVHICNHGLLIIMGIKLTVVGELAVKRPLLLVTNHISYLDVVLIAACANVKFTPKSEIGGWFFIGRWCRLCGSIFIDRRREKVGQMKQVLHDALEAGEVVCLFPEATTGNGLEVKEFKSGFFDLATQEIGGESLYVQPAAVVYTRIGGLPIDSTQWPKIAWYGDMELAPHLWELLMLPGITAEVVFLPTIATEMGGSRKMMASQSQQAIAGAIEGVRQRAVTGGGKAKGFNPKGLRKK